MVHTQKYESHITLSNKGQTFIPKNSMESSLNNISISSLLQCSKQCNENIFCRTFIYDEITLNCQLYSSDLTSGNLTTSISSTSRVGSISYKEIFYINYNKTCNYCQWDRYLTCQNNRCQCPSPITYWNGNMCENKFFYGEICNSSLQCRQDLNLSCIFQSCQFNTAVCRMGATAIIFDDLPNLDPNQGYMPSIYGGLSWTNGRYLNSSAYVGTGYAYINGFGPYMTWFNGPVTIQTLISNNTITLNSLITAAGWSNSVFLTINGYDFSSLLYTMTVPLNTYTQTILTFNWTNINKIIFTPSGSGALDTGIDNLCITF